MWSCALFSFAQDTLSTELKSDFSLTISTFNHAERLGKGTTIYKLKNDTLTISKLYMFADEEKIVFSQKISVEALEQLKNISLDNLNDFYFNNCVLIISGTEYFISTTTNSKNKKISLHHFYKKEIELLITELNKNIPDKLQLNYLKSDTKQDCE